MAFIHTHYVYLKIFEAPGFTMRKYLGNVSREFTELEKNMEIFPSVL